MSRVSCNNRVGLGVSSITITTRSNLKSEFLKLSPPWVVREFLFARRNLVLALTPLFLGNFVGILFWLSRLCFSVNLVKPKFYGLPKLCSFPVIIGFLPKSESKWGLSRANTFCRKVRASGGCHAQIRRPRDKGGGLTTSKNPTLALFCLHYQVFKKYLKRGIGRYSSVRWCSGYHVCFTRRRCLILRTLMCLIWLPPVLYRVCHGYRAC
eukprot:sb/3470242/